jgi:PAS domain S-box-containing protein
MVISVERTLEKQRLVIENRNYQQFLEQRIREATQEQRKTVSELRQTKEHLENLIESCVDAIISLDMEGKIIFCNRSTENLLGKPAAEALGAHLADFCTGGKQAAQQLIETIHQKQKVQNYELNYDAFNQQIIASVCGFGPSGRGKEGRIITIVKDITEEETENELQ